MSAQNPKKMIITLVKPFGSMLKLKDVNIYDNVFKMHTKLTVGLLLVFSCLVSAYEFFGRPMNCIVDDKDMKPFAENFCWVNGTFNNLNVTKFVEGRETWELVPEYQKYYQWVIIVLIIQAVMFYTPAFLWKGWECGRIKQLCDTLGSSVPSKEYENQKNLVVGYLIKNHSRVHAIYVFRYVICEVMNFIIVVINMWLLNAIFKNFWIRYMPAVKALFTTEGESFSSLAKELFPKTAKCTFDHFGPSGTKQIRDALCLLSLNIINEKIFAFLYIWFILLLIVSGCNLIKRSVLLVSSKLRSLLLRSILMSSGPLTKQQWHHILPNDNVGDWFLLFKLGQNLNPMVFREILSDVADAKININEKYS